MKYALILSLVSSLFLISACGVKPNNLDQPDSGKSSFPKTYPAHP